MELQIIEVEANKLKTEMNPNKVQAIESRFAPMFKTMGDLEREYQSILNASTEEITPELAQKAKELRLTYKAIRIEVQKAHKEEKQEYLKGGRLVDAYKNIYLATCDGNEDKLKEIEEHEIMKAKKKIEDLQASRSAELMQLGVGDIPEYLGAMTPEIWEAYITGVKVQHEEEQRRIEEERKAREEKARLDKIEKERFEEAMVYRPFWPKESLDLRNMSEAQFGGLMNKLAALQQEDRVQRQREAEERAELERKAKEAEEKAKKAEAKLKAQREKERKQKEAEEKRQKLEASKGDFEKFDIMADKLVKLVEEYTFSNEEVNKAAISILEKVDNRRQAVHNLRARYES